MLTSAASACRERDVGVGHAGLYPLAVVHQREIEREPPLWVLRVGLADGASRDLGVHAAVGAGVDDGGRGGLLRHHHALPGAGSLAQGLGERRVGTTGEDTLSLLER
jgi:hypothetical protein